MFIVNEDVIRRIRPMLSRQEAENKMLELVNQMKTLKEAYENKTVSTVYLIENRNRIIGEIRGIAYVLGYDVEKLLGMEE